MWGQERALALLADAGFDEVDVKRIDADMLNLYYVAPR
jgi:hypothetical protein